MGYQVRFMEMAIFYHISKTELDNCLTPPVEDTIRKDISGHNPHGKQGRFSSLSNVAWPLKVMGYQITALLGPSCSPGAVVLDLLGSSLSA